MSGLTTKKSKALEPTSVSSPVAVFAFNRLDLLSSTLEALERCEGAGTTEVHIFSDAARDNGDERAQVEAVRVWLRKWCARAGAHLHEAASNKGLRKSICDGVSQVLEQSGRVIVLEDDIVVSRGFLAFMNAALNIYEKRAEIVQVSGYIPPHRSSLAPIGLLRVPGCWGWATWSRAWKLFRDEPSVLASEIGGDDVARFNFDGSYNYFDALKRNADGTLDTWFVRWYASVFLQKGLTVYPGRSLTRNIGWNGGGANCEPGIMSRTYSRQRIFDCPADVDWDAIGNEEAPSFVAAVKEFYEWQQYQWTKPSLADRFRARLDMMKSTLTNG